MTEVDEGPRQPDPLRRRAEAAVQRNLLASREARAALSPEDVLRMVHELSVHQVELELQNEELRRAEEAREAALARYRDLYDTAPVGYCTLSDGLIGEANLTAAALLGTPREALAGQPMARFIHGPDQDRYDRYCKRLAETNEQRTCELRMVKNDQSVFWASLSGAGPAAATHLVLTDITARRQGEEENARLQNLVQQDHKLKTLGTLAGGLAHDFNNLLATIVANANLASMMVEPEHQAAAFLAPIETAAMKAAKLTRQLMAYSGQGQRAQAEMDLNWILRESFQFIPGPLASRVDLHAILSDRLPSVQGDPTQISEVIVDLLTNALEAMEPGQPGRLMVRTAAESLDPAALESGDWALPIRAPGPFATLEVTDEGAGMDSATMARLFEPFFSTKFPGRGLGLPEVIGVLRHHGGGIQVRSVPGKGSTFKLYFPALDSSRAMGSGPFLPDGRGKGRILVVDDEEDERARIRFMAEQLGFTVIEAADGPEGLELFRLHHGTLALVLLDLGLPRLDGPATLGEIRKINDTIPVVLGRPHGTWEAEAPADGRAGCLNKPYRMAEFQGLVQRTLA